MKIAMVFNGLGIGGTERIGANYAQILTNMGHEVVVFNLQPDKTTMEADFPDECSFVPFNFDGRVMPNSYLPMTYRWKWGKYVYPFVYLVSKKIMQMKKLSAKMKRWGHFDIAIAFAGHVRDLTFVQYNFISCTHKMAWLHGSLASYLLFSPSMGELYCGIKNLIVLSDDFQNYIFKYHAYLAQELQVHKILNPLQPTMQDLSDHYIAELKNQYGDFLLMVGRFDTDKDQYTTLYALKTLQDRYGEYPYFVFVGAGPTLSDVKQKAYELGVQEKTVFVGERRDVDNFYKAAHIAVHSSPAEGLPTVILEAMRAGTPVVATRSLPGVPEILGYDEYGLTCAVGDSDDMADKLYAMLSDEKLRQHYIKRGYARIKDFSPEKIAQQLEDAFNQLV